MKYALTDVIEGLLGIPIAERSQNFMTRCPFHGDDRPSMSIDLDRGLWVCFGCGEKGGLNRLANLLDADLNEGEVLIRTINAAVERGYEEPPDFTPIATRLHDEAFNFHPRALVDYLVARGLAASVVRHYRLGWDAAHGRIAMPYFDDGVCIGIKYRYPDGSKVSEKGTKRYLYGVDDIRGKDTAIICEGESDTHAMYTHLERAGLLDTVGVCGFPGVSASRSNWELYALEFLWSNKVIVAYDNDEAGNKGAETILGVMPEKAVRRAPTAGKDVAEHFMNGGSLDDFVAR
jgi:DNA primase